MSRDRINDLLIQPVLNKVDHNAILACQDRLVLLLLPATFTTALPSWFSALFELL